MGKKILFVANTDWTLYHHWLQNLEGLRAAGYELTLSSPAGPLVDKLKEAGFRHIPYEMDRGGMNLFRELFTILSIGKVLKHETPDLVHALTVKPAIYTSLLMRYVRMTNSHYRNVLILNTYTGLGSLFEEHGAFVRTVLRPILRFSFRHRFVWQSFLNDGNQETFDRMGLSFPGQCFITPSEGVDTKKFFPLEITRENKRFTVLLAARLLWSKGVGEFMEAARMVKRDAPNVRFQIVGEPDFDNPQAISKETIEQWENEGLVEFLGHRNDMPQVMQEADVLVLPSYHEGAPKVIKEAFATGIPVVASDIPGCRILVRDGVSGFLVPVKNGALLAEKILLLAQNPALTKQMGRDARLQAESEMAFEHVVKTWVDRYRTLLPE